MTDERTRLSEEQQQDVEFIRTFLASVGAWPRVEALARIRQALEEALQLDAAGEREGHAKHELDCPECGSHLNIMCSPASAPLSEDARGKVRLHQICKDTVSRGICQTSRHSMSPSLCSNPPSPSPNHEIPKASFILDLARKGWKEGK